MELLDALKNLKDPLVSGAANDILNLAGEFTFSKGINFNNQALDRCYIKQ